MPELIPAAPGTIDLGSARELAQQIKARRNGLASEEANIKDHPTYVRPAKLRQQDVARINGMVIGLTYLLHSPMNMLLAEDFIMEHGHA